ncbi:alanine--tRNA ligase-related protein [Candidatus Nanosynsacchari sp. TM7_ANC_38.39_G1_1]|uniref:alanine--tRNA ligase-related protein n=1 Tax=Candidatus Nanosynsacchari sp. TM7_ANC_38.39_G1_1 TaxID=1986206 RepID=UPI00101B6255|nr:alanine--tRNA ligase-related protein [Candidatus Nanosynsacchari sp. TM7_ANC_38.39_G1_1]RYC73667.1 Alanine--tRNA ligase [Candidatus Nanosynsacchari sp. TM7_ANC_38.39_G1_1]
MNTQEIRQKYLEFCQRNGHVVIERAPLILHNDPTTLFTGSGMQPLLPYLLGQDHPQGTKLADSQTCLRAQDIEDVGDNRHTTFFEMLGNWSMGEYFKRQQIEWFFEFLTEIVGLDPHKIYVSCFIGDEKNNIPRDDEAAQIWQEVFAKKGIEAKIVELDSAENGDKLGMRGGRIFFYDDKENWWSRGGGIDSTPIGDPCGPDSEVFYDFGEQHHDASFGQAHPASDSGRFMEIGNQVFMQYRRLDDGSFEPLKRKNVDFGGGLERIAAAAIDSPDVFKISLLQPIIKKLESLSGKEYATHTASMRVIADHLRAAVFLAVDGCVPSNKEQGYVMRRLLRRAIRYSFDLGIEQNFLEEVVPVIADLYEADFPEVKENRESIIAVLVKEEKAFRQTLRKGLRQMQHYIDDGLTGEELFTLYDTFGFPVELSTEEAYKQGIKLSDNWRAEFDARMAEQRQRSKTARKGQFSGGLEGHDPIHLKYHTATHLLGAALRKVLDAPDLQQHGSNITAERLRFDFNHDKLTSEEKQAVEDQVNAWIDADLPVRFAVYPTDEALKMGAIGAFGERYGDEVKVYSIGEGDNIISFEVCGGPHVEHTGVLAEGGKRFKITKEESSSAGIRRIKAVLR